MINKTKLISILALSCIALSAAASPVAKPDHCPSIAAYQYGDLIVETWSDGVYVVKSKGNFGTDRVWEHFSLITKNSDYVNNAEEAKEKAKKYWLTFRPYMFEDKPVLVENPLAWSCSYYITLGDGRTYRHDVTTPYSN